MTTHDAPATEHFAFHTRQYIGGQWRDGAGTAVLVNRNPYTGETLTEIPTADVTDIDAAYRAAEAAQRDWAALNQYAKRDVFERAIRYITDNSAKIVTIIADELGGTALKANFEIAMTIDMLKEAATFPLRMEGRILPSPIDDKENLVYLEPVGVVGVISPFNFPFFLGMKAVAPALACGNGVVIKPHEDTPITGGTLIGEVFEAAGLPPGLLNVILTDHKDIGDAFVDHPVPRVISFTGSAAVGQHVAQVAVRNFKKPLLELGGNSAFIVMPDADLKLAVDAAIASRFVHQGQACIAANRVLVHRETYDAFTDLYVDKAAGLVVGDPHSDDTVIGPLINERQANNLAELVSEGLAQGARAALSGGVKDPTYPTLFHPTVLVDVNPNMRVMQDEMFGPVVCLMPFDSEDDAVAIANNTRFGLSGAVHTSNLAKGIELARRIHTGMIHINDATIHDEPIVPFGGEKQSGIGRMNGAASLYELTTTKWVSVHRGRRQFPF